jgi:hypothetical protein
LTQIIEATGTECRPLGASQSWQKQRGQNGDDGDATNNSISVNAKHGKPKDLDPTSLPLSNLMLIYLPLIRISLKVTKKWPERIEPAMGRFVEMKFSHDSVQQIQALMIIAPEAGRELKMAASMPVFFL